MSYLSPLHHPSPGFPVYPIDHTAASLLLSFPPSACIPHCGSELSRRPADQNTSCSTTSYDFMLLYWCFPHCHFSAHIENGSVCPACWRKQMSCSLLAATNPGCWPTHGLRDLGSQLLYQPLQLTNWALGPTMMDSRHEWPSELSGDL